jgi:hypothetical protein
MPPALLPVHSLPDRTGFIEKFPEQADQWVSLKQNLSVKILPYFEKSIK